MAASTQGCSQGGAGGVCSYAEYQKILLRMYLGQSAERDLLFLSLSPSQEDRRLCGVSWCVPSTGSTWVCLKFSSSGICSGWSLSREGMCLQQCLVSVYEHGFEAHFPISRALLHVKSSSDAKRGAAFLRDETQPVDARCESS